jgi:FKBP-type peptidyl-prolyl cis-trans isomerase SlyD
MNITNDCVVALTWVLKDTQGEILDELDDPVEFYLGGHDLLDKIQQALQDHEVGDLIDLHLEPEEAFGDFDELLVFLEPRALFPAEIEEGMTIEGHALPKGCNEDAPKEVIYTITDIYPEHVVIDGNHPLSGISTFNRGQKRVLRLNPVSAFLCISVLINNNVIKDSNVTVKTSQGCGKTTCKD